LILFGMIVFSVLLLPTQVDAGPYSQLQVLLPGEVEDPGSQSGKTGTPNPQTVGTPFAVRIRACDADWNTVATVTNIVRLSSSDAIADLPDPAQLIDGELTLTVALNSIGAHTLSATDESDLSIPEAVSSPVDVMVLQGFQFSNIHKHQYAGQPLSLSVYAVDPNGDVVTGYTGPVSLKEITSFGEGRIVPGEIPLTNGEWSGSVTMYRADETNISNGNVNIYAYLEADPTKSGTTDPFVVHPGPFARVQIVVPGQTPLPGGISGVSGSPATQSAGEEFSVDVYSTNDFWNPLPSADNVRIISSDSEANTPQSGALVDGFQQFSIYLGTVGTQTLTVTDQSDPSIEGMTTDGIIVIPSAPDHFVIETIPTPITAGDAVSVMIRATDENNNTIPDYAGDAILSANTGPGSISPELITFASGTWTGEMVFRGAGGAVSFTCSDFSAPPNTGTSNAFQVLPGPYAGLQLLLPGETPQGGTESGYSGSPDEQDAGSGFMIMLRAVDEFWNRIQGIDNRVALGCSDAFADVPTDTTLANGEILVPVTLFHAGTQTLTASDLDSTGVDPYTSSPVMVQAGPYERILALAPGQNLAPGTEEGRTGFALDQSIDIAFTITVLATDAWWNPIGSVTDLIRLTSEDQYATLPPDTPLEDGRVELEVRLATGGHQLIWATNLSDPSMSPSETEVRAINTGFHLRAEAAVDTIQAGVGFTLTVWVENDVGTPIQEANSLVTVTAQHASTGEPGRGTLSLTQFPLNAGEATEIESYSFAEPIVLIVTDNEGSTPGATGAITVVPGTPTAIRLTSDPAWLRGNRHATVTARVVDTFENGVSEQPIAFQVIEGAGLLNAADPETDGDGTATADFLSPREPEIGRVMARSNDLTAQIEIETSLVDPSMPSGSVTNYPNPFHPGESPTTIAYKLADDSHVTLRIFTLSGSLVFLTDFTSGAPGGRSGLNEFVWNGRNGKGRVVSSGAYVLDITAKGNGETRHVMRRKLGVVR